MTIHLPEAAEIARQFHEAYERLAPDFGYRTREASAKSWADVPEQNKNLMIAVGAELRARWSMSPDPAPITAHFAGGPWDGKTVDVARIVAPVFGPGHEIGNHYWLDTKGASGAPTYHWDGTEWAEQTPTAETDEKECG